MALMNYRDGNEINWIGVRPGHRGTQIITYLKDITNTTTDLYQVGSGEIAYITSIELNCSSHNGEGYFYLTDSANTVIAILLEIRSSTPKVSPSVVQGFWPPLELISQQKLRIRSSAAGIWVGGSCHGWDE